MRLRHIGPLAVLVVALAACEAPGGGCGAREIALANQSSLAVEQLFAGTGAPGAWGRDQLAPGTLPPGGSARLRLPGGPEQAVRAVWVNGRAVELGGLGDCRLRRVVLRDATIQAE